MVANKTIKWLIILWLVSGGHLFAHEVVSQELQGIIGVEFTYGNVNGSPMAYCEFKVFAPGNYDKPAQEGETDKNGRVFFFPDKPGSWRVAVSDGMGHGKILDVSLNEEMGLSKIPSAHFSHWQKLIIGVSIIWGLTGILFYLVARRKKL